eukprot:1439853-Heterocapsa_arctica.AAC.1
MSAMMARRPSAIPVAGEAAYRVQCPRRSRLGRPGRAADERHDGPAAVCDLCGQRGGVQGPMPQAEPVRPSWKSNR